MGTKAGANGTWMRNNRNPRRGCFMRLGGRKRDGVTDDDVVLVHGRMQLHEVRMGSGSRDWHAPEPVPPPRHLRRMRSAHMHVMRQTGKYERNTSRYRAMLT